MINKTIAHYKITSKLGQGGMGEVYRSTDTKLDRDVAIKILPESFAGDNKRVARFKREAKVLATLNHPNIAAIYGIEKTEETQALAIHRDLKPENIKINLDGHVKVLAFCHAMNISA